MKARTNILDTGMSLPSPEELERAMRAGNRERAEMAGILRHAATAAISQWSQRLTRRLQSTRSLCIALTASARNPAATR